MIRTTGGTDPPYAGLQAYSSYALPRRHMEINMVTLQYLQE